MGITNLTQVESFPQTLTGFGPFPSRVWSLWELMNLFEVSQLAWLLHEIQKAEGQQLLARLTGAGAQPPTPDAVAHMKETLTLAFAFFVRHGFDDCVQDIKNAEYYVSQSILDASTAATTLNRLRSDIVQSLMKREFLHILPDRHGLIDNKTPCGDKVFEAFPAARDD